MAKLEWAALCELAFLDRHDRLCVIGMFARLSVPRVPIALQQVMLVARLIDIETVEDLSIAVGIVTPSGRTSMPESYDCVDIDVVREYVLVTLRGLPLAEEGIYRFSVALSDESIVSVDVPVIAVERAPLETAH